MAFYVQVDSSFVCGGHFRIQRYHVLWCHSATPHDSLLNSVLALFLSGGIDRPGSRKTGVWSWYMGFSCERWFSGIDCEKHFWTVEWNILEFKSNHVLGVLWSLNSVLDLFLSGGIDLPGQAKPAKNRDIWAFLWNAAIFRFCGAVLDVVDTLPPSKMSHVLGTVACRSLNSERYYFWVTFWHLFCHGQANTGQKSVISLRLPSMRTLLFSVFVAQFLHVVDTLEFKVIMFLGGVFMKFRYYLGLCFWVEESICLVRQNRPKIVIYGLFYGTLPFSVFVAQVWMWWTL